MRKDQVVFLDTETTGLDPERHKIWEVGLIYWQDGEWKEYHAFVSHSIREIKEFDVTLEFADPFALNIGKFWERYDELDAVDWRVMIDEVLALTAGKHLVGAVVSFDEERLRRYALRACFVPRWHYHIIDIEAMAVGYVLPEKVELPWKSERLYELLGLPKVSEEDKHTALGDARQVKLAFERMVQWEPEATEKGSNAEV